MTDSENYLLLIHLARWAATKHCRCPFAERFPDDGDEMKPCVTCRARSWIDNFERTNEQMVNKLIVIPPERRKSFIKENEDRRSQRDEEIARRRTHLNAVLIEGLQRKKRRSRP